MLKSKPKKENIQAATYSILKQSQDNSEKLLQVGQQLIVSFHYKFIATRCNIVYGAYYVDHYTEPPLGK